MSKVLVTEAHLNDIADAIRSKSSDAVAYRPGDMAAAIRAIETGGITPAGTLAITENGLADVTTYARANVNVQPNLQAKTVTANGEVTPDAGYDGLSRVTVNVPTDGGGGGGGGDGYAIEYAEYALFSGNSSRVELVALPITANADHEITVDFQCSTVTNNNSVFGTSGTYTNPHLTVYNSKWYVSTGGNDLNFGSANTQRHTCVLNRDNAVYMDGVAVLTGLRSTSSDKYYWLGGRGDSASNYFRGRLYRFSIASISTGAPVCDIRPARIVSGGSVVVEGLYDSVKDVFYANGMLTVAGDGQ